MALDLVFRVCSCLGYLVDHLQWEGFPWLESSSARGEIERLRAAGRNMSRAEFAEYLGADTPYRPTCPEWPLAA